MRERGTWVVAGWLVLLAAGQMIVCAQIWLMFVATPRGQELDTIALAGTAIGQSRTGGAVDAVLSAVSVVSLIAATAFIGFIALARRRIWLAVVATLLIAGANVTTQVLKSGLIRPDFGVDPDRLYAGNSFPSGHTTVAASVAVALVMVLPAKARGIGGLVAAGYAALVGVATLSAGWHRPSDAIAAYLITGAWAAVAGLVLLIATATRRPVERGPSSHAWAAMLVALALVFFGFALVALYSTNEVHTVPVEALDRTRLLTAYAGAAAGITGAAALMVALVIVTAHRVVPPLPRIPLATPFARVAISQDHRSH